MFQQRPRTSVTGWFVFASVAKEICDWLIYVCSSSQGKLWLADLCLQQWPRRPVIGWFWSTTLPKGVCNWLFLWAAQSLGKMWLANSLFSRNLGKCSDWLICLCSIKVETHPAQRSYNTAPVSMMKSCKARSRKTLGCTVRYSRKRKKKDRSETCEPVCYFWLYSSCFNSSVSLAICLSNTHLIV